MDWQNLMRIGGIALLFWVLLLLLELPWLWRTAEPEETADGQVAAARRVQRDVTPAEAFADLVAPVVDVRAARMEDGIALWMGGCAVNRRTASPPSSGCGASLR